MMSDKNYIIAACLIMFGYAVWMFRVQIVSFLLNVFGKAIKFLWAIKTKHQLETLRAAIHEADKDKDKTGRKNMVFYNTTTKKFEPIQKKKLKQLSQIQKKKKAGRTITSQRIHHLEKKSLYVTK